MHAAPGYRRKQIFANRDFFSENPSGTHAGIFFDNGEPVIFNEMAKGILFINSNRYNDRFLHILDAENIFVIDRVR